MIFRTDAGSPRAVRAATVIALAAAAAAARRGGRPAPMGLMGDELMMMMAAGIIMTVATSAASAPTPPVPVYPDADAFSLRYDSLILPEDVATVHSIWTDHSRQAALHTEAGSHGNDTTLVRNDLGRLYMVASRGLVANGPECYAFNTTGAPQRLPNLPSLAGMAYVGGATIAGEECDHYQLRRGDGSLLLGAYVASKSPRHLVQISNQDNMDQVMSSWAMDIKPPPKTIFDVPSVCKNKPLLGPVELAFMLAARDTAARGHQWPLQTDVVSNDTIWDAHRARSPRPRYTLAIGGAAARVHAARWSQAVPSLHSNGSLTATPPSPTELALSSASLACTADSHAEVRSNCEIKLPKVMATASFDAREHGWVSPPRDQGFCGSCWAFSTVATVETAAAKNNPNPSNSTPPHLSPQRLLDCVPTTLPGVKPVIEAKGCFGGWHPTALTWIHQHGVPLEANYQYAAVDGYCDAQGAVEGGVYIEGLVAVPPGDTSAMEATVMQ
jgi:hypothetical protein